MITSFRKRGINLIYFSFGWNGTEKLWTVSDNSDSNSDIIQSLINEWGHSRPHLSFHGCDEMLGGGFSMPSRRQEAHSCQPGDGRDADFKP